jgi:hypothetical protein
MLKKMTLATLMCVSLSSYANLVNLNQQEMKEVVGQGGGRPKLDLFFKSSICY